MDVCVTRRTIYNFFVFAVTYLPLTEQMLVKSEPTQYESV